ncbi:ARF GTPase-activating protein GIT1 [Galendromus occidentalis]|uniref:ARF GTPase-activating protein GIT1 n=1 Tax=Galendromus occidentalis TaxID=34638 RepID=A0AAJ6QXM6_9ACAR|nr:ARF GTPase-activating protein GIT1 [Galendromus occidentalis]
MSGVKLADLCADCCAADPGWASLSLGVLLCSRCALVHLELGRHFPQIVCLDKKLPPRQRELLEVLSTRNINSVWEHYLLDSNYTGGCRKPSPHDQNRHPTRSAFIEAKYIMLNFMERLPHDATELQTNLRLMNTVRSNDVEESLKLILQGADVRFVHPETQSTSLHNAVLAEQPLQVELLLIHGADPRNQDGNGYTALDVAKAAGRSDLVAQMSSALNQVADRLQAFAASSEINQNAPTLNLSDDVLAELCRDLYDEVERRDLLKQMGCDDVPFLPVNKAFSSVRNQSRQKLARLSKQELATLITFCVGQETAKSRVTHEDDDDDEPLYDSVCGDDDVISQAPAELLVESPAQAAPLPPPPLPPVTAPVQALPPPPPPTSPPPLQPPGFYPNLLIKTEEITKHTHNLLLAAQSQNDNCYLSICKQIRGSVIEMSYLLPQSYPDVSCKTALQELLNSANHLVESCEQLLGTDKAENAKSIIKYAYNVARGVKTFVTSFPHVRNSQLTAQLSA